MTVKIQSLEPQIRDILTAPGTDLGTISAKRVRKQLIEQNEALTAEFVKENKDEIDQLISAVYEQVSSLVAEEQDEDDSVVKHEEQDDDVPQRKSVKRKTDEDDDEYAEAGDDEEEKAASTRPKKAKKARKSKAEMTDAELARQLSHELNGRGTRSSRADRAGGVTRGKKGGRKSLKSSATVDSDEDEGSDFDRPKKRRGGFGKEYILR